MINSLCEYCFKVLERDDDGDRWYYQCPDMNCLFWENGHNENVDRIAEGIKAGLDEVGPLKAIEVKAALSKVLEAYDNRVLQISKEFD